MERGDFLMLFTDGLLDIEDPYTHESFSQQRLIDAARHRIDSPPEELFYGLLDDIHDFARGTKFEDDACLLRVALNSVGT
jgi:serine phosphatase RsbU (regulator of sigma subunit)